MNTSHGAWASYGYREPETERQNYPMMELGYDRNTSKQKGARKLLYRGQRLEKQKERVLSSTMKRMMMQRMQLQRELLRGLDQDYVESVLNKEYFLGDQTDILDFYNTNKGWQNFEKESLVSSNDVRSVTSPEGGKHHVRSAERVRPTSAAVHRPYQQPPLQGAIQKEDSNVIKRKPRIQSAPVSRRRITDGKKSKTTQDHFFKHEEDRRNTSSGCEFCPGECRPVSSSTHNRMSSTGLQSVSGPTHFHYYHYDRYLRHQRPRSAISQRLEYLEANGRSKGTVSTPRFTNIVQSCKVHSKPSRSNIDEVKSSTSHGSMKPEPPRVAWADENDLEENFIVESMENVVLEEVETHHRIGKRGSTDIDTDEIAYRTTYTEPMSADTELIDDDDLLNDDVRQQAEYSYKLVTNDIALQLAPALEEYMDSAEEEEEILTPRVPTPTPISSRSRSPEQEDIWDDKDTEDIVAETVEELEPTPVPANSTDMLTGRTTVYGESPLAQSDSPSEEEEDVPEKEFAGIRIEIHTPDPLPIKRIPQPLVQTVDIIEPREELLLKDDSFEAVQDELEDVLKTEEEINEDDQFKMISEDGKIPNIPENPPVSILKSSSQDHWKERSSSRVTFDIPENLLEREEEDEALSEEEDIVLKEEPLLVIKEEEPRKEVEMTKDEIQEEPKLEKQLTDEESPLEDDEKVVEAVPEDITPPGMKVTLTQISKTTEDPIKFVNTSTLITTPTIQKPVEQTKPAEPITPLYEEPTDEELKKLLSPPDLEGFEAPVFEPVKPRKKRSKTSVGVTGKKKKKGKKKSKASPKPTPEKPPAEPLFTYDPNSVSPVEMAKKRFSAMRHENTDLHSAISNMRDFDASCKEKMKNQPWLFGRMALSKQICRFWLPMDLRDLEGVTPSQYLTNYCVVCKRRQKLYVVAFDRQLQKRKTKEVQTDLMRKTLDIKETEKALRSVHADCIDDEHIAHVRTLVCIDLKKSKSSVTRLDSKLFCSLCALTERLFYSHFVTEDAEDNESASRQIIESADFDGLEWRLRDVNISDELRDLLFSL